MEPCEIIDKDVTREKAARAKHYGRELEQFEPARAASARVDNARVPMQERSLRFWKKLWKMPR